MSDSRSLAVVLSPHLDDAVFSCPGWIRKRADEGKRPLVVTLFSHTQHNSSREVQRVYEQRQREDERAAQLIGATRRLAGFVDAPFRSGAYRSFSGVVCQAVEEESELVPKVRDFVRRILDDLRPDCVLAPLGIGQHIDHRITQRVVADLAPLYPKVDTAFYEDRPYAFVDEAVRLRLGQIGRTGSTGDFDPLPFAERARRFFLSFFGAPYARQHLRAADQARIVAHVLEAFVRSMQEPATPAHAQLESWSPDILREVLPALDAYGSQARGFLGSPLYHQWAALEYGRRLGMAGRYVERYWYL